MGEIPLYRSASGYQAPQEYTGAPCSQGPPPPKTPPQASAKVPMVVPVG